MWTAIKYVSSGITLIAFICALAAWLYRSYLQRRENLIKTVPEGQRAQLVEKTFIPFNIDAGKLSRKHQYELALKQIRERTKQYQTTAVVTVIIAGFVTVISFVAIPRLNPAPVPQPTPTPTPTPTPGNLSGDIEGVEVIGQGENARVFINLSIKNVGAPTMVQQYVVHINHVSSRRIQYKGPPMEITQRFTVPQADGKHATVIQPQDSILVKTRQAIGSKKVTGWLALSLPLPADELRQPGIRYTVSFADTTGNTYQATYQVQ